MEYRKNKQPRTGTIKIVQLDKDGNADDPKLIFEHEFVESKMDFNKIYVGLPTSCESIVYFIKSANEADKFVKALEEAKRIHDQNLGREIETAKESILKNGLVLCGECRYWKTEDDILGMCEATEIPILFTGYCNFGVKAKDTDKKKPVEFTQEEKDLAKTLHNMGFNIVSYDRCRNEFHLKSDIWKIGFHTSDCLFPTMVDNGINDVDLILLAEGNDKCYE